MRLAGVQVGRPQELLDAAGKPWKTAFQKTAASGPVQLSPLGLHGDGQANKKHHGGEEMAVLAYPAAHYPRWREELDWPSLPFGGFGENFTVEGADEESVCVGDVWQLPGVQLQVSSPRTPCNNIPRFWKRPELLKQVVQTGRSGWYLRVLKQGWVQAGDELQLVERPHPDWPISRALAVSRAKGSPDAIALSRVAALSPRWQAKLSTG